jgi:hypothetical protein
LISIQGFDNQKLNKKIQLKFFSFLIQKFAIYLSLGLHKECPSSRRSLQPSKVKREYPALRFHANDLTSIRICTLCVLVFLRGFSIFFANFANFKSDITIGNGSVLDPGPDPGGKK